MVAVEMVFPVPVPIRMGYTLQPLTHLIQGVDLLGPLLLTATLVSLNVAVYAGAAATLRRTRVQWVEVTVGPALVLLLFWYGTVRMPSIVGAMASAPSLRVGVIQPGLGPIEKWRAPVEGLVRCRRGSEAAERRGAELTVWPEAACNVRRFAPGRLERRTRSRRAAACRSCSEPSCADGRATAPRRNSAVMTTPDGKITGVYDKMRLVPVSEALPSWVASSWLRRFAQLRTRIEPGDFPRSLPLDHRGRRWSIGALICYEDVMPGYVRRVIGATATDGLVSLSNDSWFGETAEPRGHLQVAAFRAVEQRRFLVRATNTGVTALVDPRACRRQARPFQTAVMLGEVRLLRGQTLYQRWGDILGPLPRDPGPGRRASAAQARGPCQGGRVMHPILTRLPGWVPLIGGAAVYSYGSMLGLSFAFGWLIVLTLAARDGILPPRPAASSRPRWSVQSSGPVSCS